ncbi:unnamed protein product, partial [Protopolystoma xenopodis]
MPLSATVPSLLKIPGNSYWSRCSLQIFLAIASNFNLASFHSSFQSPAAHENLCLAAHEPADTRVYGKGDCTKVLFPLLARVSLAFASAPADRDPSKSHSSLLMHHSRDTAAKQWAETMVLILTGVTHSDFYSMWHKFLDCIESCALCPNSEISINALHSLQSLLDIGVEDGNVLSRTALENQNHSKNCLDDLNTGQMNASELWEPVWHSWLNIGTFAFTTPVQNCNSLHTREDEHLIACTLKVPLVADNRISDSTDSQIIKDSDEIQIACFPGVFMPSPSYVAIYFNIFSQLYPRIARLSPEQRLADFDLKLVNVFRYGVLSPIYVATLQATSLATAAQTTISQTVSSTRPSL